MVISDTKEQEEVGHHRLTALNGADWEGLPEKVTFLRV